MPSQLDRDLALERVDGRTWRGRAHGRWWAPVGPNGGFLAALVVRALEEAVGEPERRPRSLTLHYLSTPDDGPLDIEVDVVRAGRSLTSLTARVVQEGQPKILALAALSRPRAAPAFADLAPPDVPPPHACPVRPPPTIFRVAIAEQFEARPVIGGEMFSGTGEAVTGAWLRLLDPRPVDAALVALLTDAWMPAVFTRATEPIGGVPTVDLTIHFRNTVPPDQRPEDPCLVVFRTCTSAEGFIEEDGEIWSRGGVLLAQSRQLALLRG